MAPGDLMAGLPGACIVPLHSGWPSRIHPHDKVGRVCILFWVGRVSEVQIGVFSHLAIAEITRATCRSRIKMLTRSTLYTGTAPMARIRAPQWPRTACSFNKSAEPITPILHVSHDLRLDLAHDGSNYGRAFVIEPVAVAVEVLAEHTVV